MNTTRERYYRIPAHLGAPTGLRTARNGTSIIRQMRAERNVTPTGRELRPATETRLNTSSETGSSARRGSQNKITDYIIKQTLGTGAYATVKLAVHKTTGMKYAIKTYEKFRLVDPHRKKSVQREIQILEKLDHPNAMKLCGTIDNTKQLHLVQEYVNGCSLYQYIKKRPTRRLLESTTKKIFSQVINCIAYLHSHQIHHRDIKLENILISKDHAVKVIDFGFSTCFSNERKVKLCCGTPSYMAPEIVKRREFTGPPVDIWALGVMLYAMLSGTFPFKGTNDKDLYRKIALAKVTFPESIPKSARGLISQMLSYSADDRPTANDILAHPWVTGSFKESFHTFDFHKTTKHNVSISEVVTRPSSESIDSLDKDATE